MNDLERKETAWSRDMSNLPECKRVLVGRWEEGEKYRIWRWTEGHWFAGSPSIKPPDGWSRHWSLKADLLGEPTHWAEMLEPPNA